MCMRGMCAACGATCGAAVRTHAPRVLNQRCCCCGALARAGSCTQWGIYDEYLKDLERQRYEEDMKSKGKKKNQPQGGDKADKAQSGAAAKKGDDGALQSGQLRQVRACLGAGV